MRVLGGFTFVYYISRHFTVGKSGELSLIRYLTMAVALYMCPMCR